MPGYHDLTIRTVEPDDAEAIPTLILDAFEAGELKGSRRLDCEHWARLASSDPENSLVALHEGALAGLITPRWNQVVVAPVYRRLGIGSALVEAGERLAAERGEAPLALALPHDNLGAQRFLESLEYAYHHSLWRMRFASNDPLPEPPLPAEVFVRSYAHEDLEPYVALFNAAFADHPTPLSLTVDLAQRAHSREGFDPEDILLAVRAADGQLVGFCRIVIEPGEEGPEGEVVVLGVIPSMRGRGVGRRLLTWGVQRARGKGAANVFLAVEGDNEKALNLYRSVGFVLEEEWPRWCRAG